MRLTHRRWSAAAIAVLAGVLAAPSAASEAQSAPACPDEPTDATEVGCAYADGALPPGPFTRQLTRWARSQGVALSFSEVSDAVGDLVSLTDSAPPDVDAPPGLDIERVLWARAIATPRDAVLRLLGQEGWRVGGRPGGWLGRSIDLVVLDLAGPAFVLASDTIAAWALGTTGDGPAVPATLAAVNNPVAGIQHYLSFGDYAGRAYQAATDFASADPGADGTPFYNAPARFAVWRDITQDVVAFLLPSRSLSEVFTVNTFWSEGDGWFDLAAGEVSRYLERPGVHPALDCLGVSVEHVEGTVDTPYTVDGASAAPATFPARLRHDLVLELPGPDAPRVDVDVRVDERDYAFQGLPTEVTSDGAWDVAVPVPGLGRVELVRVAIAPDADPAWQALGPVVASLGVETPPVLVTPDAGFVWGTDGCTLESGASARGESRAPG